MNKKTRISSFYKFIAQVCIVLVVIMFCTNTVEASDATVEEDSYRINPSEGQYFELKATTINDVEGQGKQVIMELWGHEIDFGRISSKI